MRLLLYFFYLQFARHIKKSEGQKTPKVELQISIYGVKILDPKTKVRDLHVYGAKLVIKYWFNGFEWFCFVF